MNPVMERPKIDDRKYARVLSKALPRPIRDDKELAARTAELLRLDNRLPGLDASHRDEVARTVRRVVDKLLHAPTVRVKQLAGAPGGDSYAEALRELFELDPQAVEAVSGGELPLVAPDSASMDFDKTE